jgi:hypothetical protein
MTIHWKAFEEHFLIPLVFRFNRFQVKNLFAEFFSKNLSPPNVKANPVGVDRLQLTEPL